MATSKKTTSHPKKATNHVSHKDHEFVEKIIGYDGKDDGMRPLRMSVILITLLSILVVSIITYFVGAN